MVMDTLELMYLDLGNLISALTQEEKQLFAELVIKGQMEI